MANSIHFKKSEIFTKSVRFSKYVIDKVENVNRENICKKQLFCFDIVRNEKNDTIYKHYEISILKLDALATNKSFEIILSQAIELTRDNDEEINTNEKICLLSLYEYLKLVLEICQMSTNLDEFNVVYDFVNTHFLFKYNESLSHINIKVNCPACNKDNNYQITVINNHQKTLQQINVSLNVLRALFQSCKIFMNEFKMNNEANVLYTFLF